MTPLTMTCQPLLVSPIYYVLTTLNELTSGVDFKVKTLVLSGKRVKLSIWVIRKQKIKFNPFSKISLIGHGRAGEISYPDPKLLQRSTRSYSGYVTFSAMSLCGSITMGMGGHTSKIKDTPPHKVCNCTRASLKRGSLTVCVYVRARVYVCVCA